jgi:hypothetical protein
VAALTVLMRRCRLLQRPNPENIGVLHSHSAVTDQKWEGDGQARAWCLCLAPKWARGKLTPSPVRQVVARTSRHPRK